MHKTYKIVLILISAIIGFTAVGPAYAMSIMVHVPEKYTDVEAGERFYFEIEIKYPENPRRKDLRLNYEITDKSGEVIAQAKHLKAIETQASFMDYIVIPESVKEGLYIINVGVTDYEDLNEEVSASFHVTYDNGVRLKIYFYVLLGAVLLVGTLVIEGMYINRKK